MRNRSRLRRWTAAGGWALCDQALFALSNFLIAVLLGRWLSPQEYGAFVASYAMFLVGSVLHSGAIAEPLVIFGSSRYRPWFSDYLRLLLGEHLKLTLAIGGGMAGLGAILGFAGQPLTATAVIGMAVATPFLLLASLARRACYAQSRPRRAAGGSAIFFVTVACGLWLLSAAGRLAVLPAQLLLASAAILMCTYLLPILLRITDAPLPRDMKSQARADHWRFGRWSTSSGVLNWVQMHGYLLVLAYWAGLEALAGLRAAFNLVLPMLHAGIALAALLPPVLVRSRYHPGRFRRRVVTAALLGAIAAISYACALWAAHEPLMRWLYGGVYVLDDDMFLLLVCIPPLASVFNVLAAALTALERPIEVFRAVAGGAVVTITVGTGAVVWWGATGALVGMVAASLVQVVLAGHSLRTAQPPDVCQPALDARAPAPAHAS